MGVPQRASRLPSLPKPRSPLGRAVLPVLGGFVVLVLIFAATWGMAAWIARGGAESTSRLAPESLPVGNVTSVAETIDESGPVLYPGLDTTTGERTLVLNHTGDDPTREWRVYWAYPADRDPTCGVEQVRHSDRFTDCDGREIDVSELAPPEGVCPVVENRARLSINLTCNDLTPATIG